jgi:hypothetical protein
MALWNTFDWSDGTLWADAHGSTGPYTAGVERSAYRVSLKITHANDTYPGSLSSFILRAASAEVGVRPQLPSHYEAFIDRNENSQRISVVVRHTADEPTEPFAIHHIHMLVTTRSRRQPTS